MMTSLLTTHPPTHPPLEVKLLVKCPSVQISCRRNTHSQSSYGNINLIIFSEREIPKLEYIFLSPDILPEPIPMQEYFTSLV